MGCRCDKMGRVIYERCEWQTPTLSLQIAIASLEWICKRKHHDDLFFRIFT
jgi:hypothetical protein